MATTSSSKNTFASFPDAQSLNHPIGEFSFCPHCFDSAGFLSDAPVYPFMPDEPLQCCVCGHFNYDLSAYSLIRSACKSICSPTFATFDEVCKYREIFGATEQAGYEIWEWTFRFTETRQQGRFEMLDDLAASRLIYDRLIAVLAENPTESDLQTITLELGLHRYPLPIFSGRLSRRAS